MSKQTDRKRRSEVKNFEQEIPDSWLLQARDTFFDAVGGPTIAASRSFVLAFGLVVVVILQIIQNNKLTDLAAKVTPYVVTVNEELGQVAPKPEAAKPADAYKIPRNVLDREIFNFVKNLYSIDSDAAKQSKERHVAAWAYTRDKARTEFKEFLSREQVYQRMKKTPGLVRTVEKKSITYRDDASVALIRFVAIERTNERPQPIEHPLVIQISYKRAVSDKREELDENPLGIYITHFEIQEDR